MAISIISDGESASSVRTKLNSAIGEVNVFTNVNTITDVTLSGIQTLISNSTLVPRIIYHVTDLDVYFRAITSSTLESKGVREMLVPAIYEPTTDSYSNVWKGSWYGTGFTYSIDDLAIHFGHVYKSLTGAVGTSGAGTYGLELDDTNWSKIEKASFTNHEYTTEYYGCTVDWINGIITSQWDSYNNVVETGYAFIQSVGYNSIDYCDWNWNSSTIPTSSGSGGYFGNNIFKHKDAIFANEFVGFANNLYTTALGNNCENISSNIGCYIEDNDMLASVDSNVCYSLSNIFQIVKNKCQYVSSNAASSTSAYIVSNTIPGYIAGNIISGYIWKNKNTGDISNNTVTSILGNFNNGDIDNNTMASYNISINSNNGDIDDNECGNDIIYNSNIGNIHNNTNTLGIANNANNGDIQNNTNGANIAKNYNNGSIFSNSCTSYITNNTNTGNISGNSMTGYIANNANNGAITDNGGTGNIQHNINNGYIDGLTLSANIEDTIVNKE